MGQCLEVYCIEHQWLKDTIDSGQDAVRRAISGRFRSNIYRDNDWNDLSNDRGAPNIFEAIRDLIMGDPRDLDDHLYWYAFKYIVNFNGRFLDNSQFCPFRGDYLGDIGEELKGHGAGALDLYSLAWGGSPSGTKVPQPMDGVNFGRWEAAEIKDGLAALSAASDLSPACASVLEWLKTADERGHILVGIHTI